MAVKYLDYAGLAYFWSKLKAYFVKQETGKGLSTNDFTTELKTKLEGIAAGADVNVQSDWNQADNTADDYIKNKPTFKTINGTAITGTGDFAVPAITETSNIEALSGDVIEGLKVGDVVVKVTGTLKHSYRVSFKNATGMCLTYSDASNVETVAYDKTDDTWAFTDKTITNIGDVATGKQDKLIAGANIQIAADGKTISATDTTYESKVAAQDGTDVSLVTTGEKYIWNNMIPSSEKGAANGVVPLNASSKIDATYLPSYVDDVIEAYPVGATELAADWLSLTSDGAALTPEASKIYILMADSTSYGTNTQFRWSGTGYVKMLDGGVTSITNGEIDTIVAA